ncbi:MAG TPA: Na+/H+ antiporter NhaA [Desulfuromonas sp.]|nr:Na+/H+ antiporter NhaA [Desulfuromonas sp.]
MTQKRSGIVPLLQHEAAGGVLLLLATICAMALANSPWRDWYAFFLETPVAVQIGQARLAKPLLLWINDGLMAIFFLLIGLELKREVVAGELSQPAQVVLPLLAAVGGMVVPALIYLFFNSSDPTTVSGWAIPAATDIAFALGVLALLGSRVPRSLKLFLLTLAIADDLGAIVIIALFYSSNISFVSLLLAALVLVILFFCNRGGVRTIAPYLVLGFFLWLAVLKSGVHATLAGVVLAFFLPLRGGPPGVEPPLRQLEHDLQPAVVFVILPLFAFANTGIALAGLTPAALLQPVPLGIALGLLLGKLIGIFGCSWLAVKAGLARLPEGASWRAMAGVALLCGIGFTMSLFISSLAFEQGEGNTLLVDRLGILVGSGLSGLAGYVVLRLVLPSSEAGRQHRSKKGKH